MQHWPKAIILVDMNAFFAAIEQLDHPEWQGRALAVTNGKQGTCIITCSYEARLFGIKTGMRLSEAKRLCSHLVQIPARPNRYASVSTSIMDALSSLTPDIEFFSVDEAFLDVTKCQMLHGSPEVIGVMAKKLIYETTGLHCSIGVSGDKTTAKYAAKLNKPNGLTIIPPWQAKEALRYADVTALCGISKGIGGFLKQHGATKCGEVENIPIGVLAKRFGNLGRRIWYMCQGADPDPVHTIIASPKSMGHGKVMPPGTTNPNTIDTYIMHMCAKLGERLRRHHFKAKYFFAGLLHYDYGWIGGKGKQFYATNDSKEIYDLASFIIHQHWHGEPISQIQITALDPSDQGIQFDFLHDIENPRRDSLNQTIDAINDTYGEFFIAPARMLNRSQMPNVIAPAWKPYGHRKTI